MEQSIRISQSKKIYVLKLQKHRCSGARKGHSGKLDIFVFALLCCVVIWLSEYLL